MDTTECDGYNKKVFQSLKIFIGQNSVILQPWPPKNVVWALYEVLILGGVFLGVKNNSNNLETKKNVG